MPTIHSSSRFHAVGHGTFFTSRLVRDEPRSAAFVWVYDCGSQRAKALADAAAAFELDVPAPAIDALCISHFDGDHVNGLSALLARFEVRTLVLPYLSFERRLAIAATLVSEDRTTASAAWLALDPISYLLSSDQGRAVRSIVLIRGRLGSIAGEQGPPFPSPDLPHAPRPQQRASGEQSPGAIRRKRPASLVSMLPDNNYVSLKYWRPTTKTHGDIGVTIRDHSEPVTLTDLEWELVFFNEELPRERTPRSGQTLKEVQREVRAVLRKFQILDARRAPKAGWLKVLRNCYDRHFGNSPQRRNSISLLVLSRPTTPGVMNPCRVINHDRKPRRVPWMVIPPALYARRPNGLLLTGDAILNPRLMERLIQHVTPKRWQELRVMQIPHHGSRRSWSRGLESMCTHECSVFCVADADKRKQHPHPDVVSELEGRYPLFATYHSEIVYEFDVEDSDYMAGAIWF